MKPKIKENCIACGVCEGICPEVFKVQEVDDKMIAVVQDADYDTHKEKIEESAAACAVQAIELE